MPVITLQVYRNAPTHPLATAEDEAYRYRNGDIIGVIKTTDYATLSGSDWLWDEPLTSPQLVLVHVTEFPQRLIQNILRLAESHKFLNQKFRKRRFRIPPSVVPAVARNKLNSDGQITVNFTQVKQFVRKKGVTNIADSSTDDETTQLTDADLE